MKTNWTIRRGFVVGSWTIINSEGMPLQTVVATKAEARRMADAKELRPVRGSNQGDLEAEANQGR